jgi:hypothetical protein
MLFAARPAPAEHHGDDPGDPDELIRQDVELGVGEHASSWLIGRNPSRPYLRDSTLYMLFSPREDSHSGLADTCGAAPVCGYSSNHHGRDPGINSEFAGPTFSRDGRILFVNIYAGWILAVTGPWQ